MYSYNGILLSDKKEQNAATCYNMDESQIHFTAPLLSPSPSLPLYLHKEEVIWTHSKTVATYKPGGGISPKIHHAGTLLWDFQPPELWENTGLLFKNKKKFCVKKVGHKQK